MKSKGSDYLIRSFYFGLALAVDLVVLLTGQPQALAEIADIPGKIEAESFTAYYDTTPGNHWDVLRPNQDVDIKNTSDVGGGYSIGLFDANEWLRYRIHAAESAWYRLKIRLGSKLENRKFRVELDGTVVDSSIPVPVRPDWDQYATVVLDPIQIKAGDHTLRIVMGSNSYMDFNWISVEKTTDIDSLPAVYYIDQDDSRCSDSGQGTSARPLCTLQEGFDRVMPGEVIRIRESDVPYNESAKARRSGTNNKRIIVEGDIGHNPVLTYAPDEPAKYAGAIEIRDNDYWTIRKLTFDGTGIQTSRFAVLVQGKEKSVTGNRIVKNTIINWGGRETNLNVSAVNIAVAGNAAANHLAIRNVVRQNTFIGNRGRAINLTRQKNGLVESNTISGQRCGKRTFVSPHTGKNVHTAVGIHVSHSSSAARSTVIRNNVIRDFAPGSDCSKRPQPAIGIWADVDADNGEIYNNTVHHIIPRGLYKEASIGIMIEAKCDDWQVYDNLVHHIGGIGIRNGNEKDAANNNIYNNNTLYRAGRYGFKLVKGSNLAVTQNTVEDSGEAQIFLQPLAIALGGHTIDHNTYFDSDGNRIGKYGNREVKGLSGWRADCRCDAHSQDKDPGSP